MLPCVLVWPFRRRRRRPRVRFDLDPNIALIVYGALWAVKQRTNLTEEAQIVVDTITADLRTRIEATGAVSARTLEHIERYEPLSRPTPTEVPS